VNLRVVAPTVVRPDEEFAIKIVPLVQLERRPGVFEWIMLGHCIFPGGKLRLRLVLRNSFGTGKNGHGREQPA